MLAVTAVRLESHIHYMAAESLENKAKEMGITIKVRPMVRWCKNVLTAEEIKEASDCIIIAADKDVKMARFNQQELSHHDKGGK